MKKTIVFVFVLIFLSVSAVCGSDLTEVQKAGVLQLGVSPDKAPFVFYDADDELTGIDVKLMEEAANRMGVSLEVSEMSGDDLIDSLQIGQVDILGGAFSKTRSRMNQIDFTNNYYIAEAVFIGKAGLALDEPLAPSSFSGKKVGVLKNSGFEEWVKTELYDKGFILKKSIYTYDKMDDAMKALDKGKIDLLMIEYSLYQARYQDPESYRVFEYGSIKDNYAFGVRKGSDLKAEINRLLTEMMKDGTAQQIADTFFLMDMTEQPVIRWSSKKMDTTPTPTPAATSSLAFPSVPTMLPTAAVQQNCTYGMAYVADITIPDGHQVSKGSSFTKTWRIRNTGTCPWTKDFIFGYVSGERMDGADSFLPATVYPGDSLDISINMTAPSNPGSYQGNWQLKTPQGHGIGSVIWVQINVTGSYSEPVSAKPIYVDPAPTATPFFVSFATLPSHIVDPAPTATPFFVSFATLAPHIVGPAPTATPSIGKIKEPIFILPTPTPIVFEKIVPEKNHVLEEIDFYQKFKK